MANNYLFIDRDGTLITEPADNFQVDSVHKLAFEADVIPTLLALQQAGYTLVMVTNQDGLGTASFPYADFDAPHQLMMHVFTSQGIHFKEVLICPHLPSDNCQCRKPNIGLLTAYLLDEQMDRQHSYVIGDRVTDLQLADNLEINGILYHTENNNWKRICQQLTQRNRHAHVNRHTNETQIDVKLWLDMSGQNHIDTGIAFFDHMLEQIATHAGFRLHIQAQGDVHIDDHHTVEDTALSLGEALKIALGDKRGINRFGFFLPMDECLAKCALDLSGRPYLAFNATFNYQKVGDLSTEMVKHFFYSLSYALACTLHIETHGENDHHRVESLFKVFGRTLRQAIQISNDQLPSSKGVL